MRISAGHRLYRPSAEVSRLRQRGGGWQASDGSRAPGHRRLAPSPSGRASCAESSGLLEVARFSGGSDVAGLGSVSAASELRYLPSGRRGKSNAGKYHSQSPKGPSFLVRPPSAASALRRVLSRKPPPRVPSAQTNSESLQPSARSSLSQSIASLSSAASGPRDFLAGSRTSTAEVVTGSCCHTIVGAKLSSR